MPPTLAVLYHMVKRPREVEAIEGARSILAQARVEKTPAAKVAVFVGNAWDPSEECPTPGSSTLTGTAIKGQGAEPQDRNADWRARTGHDVPGPNS